MSVFPLNKLRKLYSLAEQALYEPLAAALMYHRVDLITYDFEGPDQYTVTPSTFENHLAFLTKNFNIISSSELHENLNRLGEYEQPPVVLTFDDGFRDFYTNALPLLEEYNAPATIFVTTSFLDHQENPIEFQIAEIIRQNEQIEFGDENINTKTAKAKTTCYQQLKSRIKNQRPQTRKETLKVLKDKNDFRQGKRLMLNWEECRELSKHDLVTIGSHGINHVPINILSKQEIDTEIIKSKKLLESELSNKIFAFSYPYGAYNRRAISTLKAADYNQAFTTSSELINRWNKGKAYQLPRLEAPTVKMESSIVQDTLNSLC